MAEIAFDEAAHTYTVDGKRWPSVTQVLSFLDDWERVPLDVLQAAARFGTHVHKAAALLVRGRLDFDSLDPHLRGPIEALQSFLNTSGAVVVASEKVVHHPTLRYAGTLDVLLHWRNGIALADFKTGATVPKSVGPQTAAYAEALAAMGVQKVKRRYCIQLLMDGKYKVQKLDDPRDWSIFQSCLNLHRYKHGG